MVQVQFEVTGGIENDDMIATATLDQRTDGRPLGTLWMCPTAPTLSKASPPLRAASVGTSPGITDHREQPGTDDNRCSPFEQRRLLSGSQNLDATATSGVVQVQFELTGGALNGYVIATATPTAYGLGGGLEHDGRS